MPLVKHAQLVPTALGALQLTPRMAGGIQQQHQIKFTGGPLP